MGGGALLSPENESHQLYDMRKILLVYVATLQTHFKSVEKEKAGRLN